MIVISQMNVRPWDPEKNVKKIIEDINKAKDMWKDMIIFPELAVPGYLLWDTWEQDGFVSDCIDMNSEIIEATKGKITAIWWNVFADKDNIWDDWRLRKYNSAYIASDGKTINNWVFCWVTHKTLMPKYRLFDDRRHFMSMQNLALEQGKDIKELLKPFELTINWIKKKVWITICEDLWDDSYSVKPTDILKQNWSDIIVNISSSPYYIWKYDDRTKLLERQSKNTKIYYANNVWIQNNWKNIYVMDGDSAIYQDWNRISDRITLDDSFIEESKKHINVFNYSEISSIHKKLIYSIKEFFEQIGKQKVIIGLSWWVDSAVVATLMVEALWKENVIAVNMPSKYNSNTTKSLAEQLSKNLWIEYKIIPIEESVVHTKKQIEEVFWIEIKGIVDENIQARDRWARVLAAVAAANNAIFTNNWNKTETALGYATLYGDISWAVAPIADLYKTQVYDLAKYLNRDKEIIPTWIIDIVPSAELSDNQDVDKDMWDPIIYEYHDKLLYTLIEMWIDPETILEKYMDRTINEFLSLEKDISQYFETAKDFIEDFEKIYKSFKINFFKRIQSPPIISVSKRPFWYDLREAQNWVYFTRKYRKLKDEILK